jgi:hypothetical protein
MWKLGFVLGGLWLGGFAFLVLQAGSRFMFDRDLKVHGELRRGELFWARVAVAALWPLMVLSGGGRKAISQMMKGQK